MIVLKFGGTSVEDGRRISDVSAIVAPRAREGCLVVVSALAGVTDGLLAAAEMARRGESFEVGRHLAALAARHQRVAEDSGATSGDRTIGDEVSRTFARLSEQVRGVALLSELSARTRDAIVSAGELLSSRIMAGALRSSGCPAIWRDPRELLTTSSEFGAAVPDELAIAVAMRSLAGDLDGGTVVVTGGFVGRDPNGETTTLGRGGSDYSASLFGAALGASAIEIWTDVDGLMTANPRLVPDARLVPEVSYAEAAELAYFGAKVLHPATIRPAVARDIPVWIRNTGRPECPGTAIRREAAGSGVRALASRAGEAAIFIRNPRMLLGEGYASRVFGVFERHGVAVDVIATSEISISTTVDDSARIDRIIEDLGRFCEVDVIRDLAVVSVVGQRLRSTPGIAATAFAAINDINVVMISQGASETNLTFVVGASDAEVVVRRLHHAFFDAQSRRTRRSA